MTYMLLWKDLATHDNLKLNVHFYCFLENWKFILSAQLSPTKGIYFNYSPIFPVHWFFWMKNLWQRKNQLSIIKRPRGHFMCVCVWFLIHFFVIRKTRTREITESWHIKNYIKCNRKIDNNFFFKKMQLRAINKIHVCILISIENFPVRNSAKINFIIVISMHYMTEARGMRENCNFKWIIMFGPINYFQLFAFRKLKTFPFSSIYSLMQSTAHQNKSSRANRNLKFYALQTFHLSKFLIIGKY